MDKLIVFVLSVTLLTFMITIHPAFAEPVRNPENGHYYEYIDSSDISWYAAAFYSEISEFDEIRGHLATITSQDENDYVNSLITNNTKAWIGLYDSVNEGTHKWVTDEIYSYTNWDTNQPEQFHNDEDYGFFQGNNSKWSDVSNDHSHPTGYIIEYSIFEPFNRDLVYNPDNGHYYLWVYDGQVGSINDPLITWDYANEVAESYFYKGTTGHLVTITDEDENVFVKELIPYFHFSMIGLSDIGIEGEYKWVTDEPFNYSNFLLHTINTDSSDNIYLQDPPLWVRAEESQFSNHWNLGFIVEFSP